ncbi:MAG: glucose-6-phosphate dehydrogenase [Candidatus Dadabacteria bacterium]|nr:glucose-6-phosphate dehydrogenase [Candidatus Dadabacteria bacterium]
MERSPNFILVIFGASGDLTKRKLMPALYALYKQNLLSERFAILGTSRSALSDEAFRERIIEGIKIYGDKNAEEHMLHSFSKNVYYLPFDAAKNLDYPKLKARLSKIDDELKIEGNYIYYLSTSPNLFPIITESLGIEGLNKEGNGSGWKRIVIEKPFGHDLESAKELNETLLKIFEESQVYRIDHYLGKETVQNILAFRFSNGIFEPLWNRNYVHHVEVTAAEQIGVEERGEYYDQYGALRDMVQNHLLNIVGIVAMEPPSFFDATAVRNETVKVFQSFRPIKPEETEKYVVRGQYTDSTIHGEKISGYRNERNVSQDSRTETFAALKSYIDNWRWGGVPFYIRTGKRLPTRVSEVVIHFKKTPHHLFTQNNLCDVRRNQLIIRIQPDEGILLKFGMKMPGAGFEIKDVNMDFHYSELSDAYIPEAYERLLLDCMLGDATLYARTDAVESCWRYLDPILKAWKERQDIKIYGYPAGTWGPKEAHELFDNRDEDWRYPCKNLSTDGEYCEL